MKFALITDGNWGPLQRRRGFHMFLAQYFDDKSYANMAYELRSADMFMILDNGVAEGRSVPWERVMYIADEFRFDEVILLDAMRDRTQTFENAMAVQRASVLPPCRRMVVPQGRTWAEWEQCAWLLVNSVEFATIGISKYLETFRGGRKHAVDYLIGIDNGRHNIHMLGLQGSPVPEITKWGKYRSYIRSVDSAAPLAWAQNNAMLDKDTKGHFSFEWNKQADYELVLQNLVSVDRVCNEQVSFSKM